ncbi:hypothetical protein M0R19_04765 [Candidatus Pacearchaeota archaeon]|jgi:hypothetical protein|nr:hypothetical protein [Candidatus Pacearchaeota archaeon]
MDHVFGFDLFSFDVWKNFFVLDLITFDIKGNSYSLFYICKDECEWEFDILFLGNFFWLKD